MMATSLDKIEVIDRYITDRELPAWILDVKFFGNSLQMQDYFIPNIFVSVFPCYGIACGKLDNCGKLFNPFTKCVNS